MLVPLAHGLSSALNKKVFDVYEIMQLLPLRAVDTGDIAGLKCRNLNLRYVPAVPWVCRGFNFPFK